MLFERTFEEILSETLTELVDETPINRSSRGSKARAILEAVGRKLNESYRIFDLNLARSFVAGANGKFMDFIGELMGLPRLGTEAAVASAESLNVRFFVETGTFGNINSAADITIPAGTVISTQTGGIGIRYRLVTSVTLNKNLSEQFIAVEAVVPGEAQNVGQVLLNFHNFINYTDTDEDTLKVTNDHGIFTGRDIETDTNYRFRLTRRVTEAEAANRTAVQLAAISVPGVADIILQPFSRGIGTYDLLIKSVTPTVSSSLTEAVQAAIDEVTALGIIGLARKPLETGISMTMSLFFRETLTEGQKNDIADQVRDSLTEYINSLDIGEDFIINEAVQRTLEVDNKIKDIGVPTKPFDVISVHRESLLQDNKVKETLIANYVPQSNERVIVEPTVAEPFTINFSN